MSAPKVGDRVRVVIEGEVRDATGYITIGPVGRANHIDRHADHVVSVEVLPPPEPEYQPGDVVIDARGRVFTRLDARDRFVWGASKVREGLSSQPEWRWHDRTSHTYPQRPLALLVRNGKVV